MFPAGLEPATFRMWGGRDNHYITEMATERDLNINESLGKPCTLYILPIFLLFGPVRGPLMWLLLLTKSKQIPSYISHEDSMSNFQK